MSDSETYLFVSLGVFVAVIFPVISGFIRKQFPPTGALGVPPWLKKYVALLLFSLITALIALAIYKSQNTSAALEWHTAFLLGFAWESTIEKFRNPIVDLNRRR